MLVRHGKAFVPAKDSRTASTVRYEPGEHPPLPTTVGLGLQFGLLAITGIVLTPAIVVRAAGGSEAYLSWAVFTAVIISGATTIVQAARIGRFGSGHILLMGTSGAFISVSAAALVAGGPSLLATLIVVSASIQFALAAHLSAFRRILTPIVGGTVLMLIPVTIMSFLPGLIGDVPEGTHPAAGGLTMLATLGTLVVVALLATGALRLWAPVIGVISGSLVGAFFGLYDVSRVAEAPWIGGPQGAWPGMDLSFGPAFWTHLPAFIFVTVVGAIETIGDSIAIQRVSWRRQRAIDFRSVQGAVNADGLGNLLSGLAGTVPNTTYSSTVSLTELTGVAARHVGVAVGFVFVGLAFFPKLLALVLAMPGPVAAGFVLVTLAMLFVLGMRIVIHDQLDYRKGLVVGISFWLGAGVESRLVFPEFLSEFAGGLLQDGMMAGGLVAMCLSLFLELGKSRSRRIEVAADVSALPKVVAFLNESGHRFGWSAPTMDKIHAAAEETLLTILQIGEEGGLQNRRLLLSVQRQDRQAVMEFVTGSGEGNLQDQLAVLDDPATPATMEQQMSLRLLRHFSSSVHHQQYHEADVVTVKVEVD